MRNFSTASFRSWTYIPYSTVIHDRTPLQWSSRSKRAVVGFKLRISGFCSPSFRSTSPPPFPTPRLDSGVRTVAVAPVCKANVQQDEVRRLFGVYSLYGVQPNAVYFSFPPGPTKTFSSARMWRKKLKKNVFFSISAFFFLNGGCCASAQSELAASEVRRFSDVYSLSGL